MERDLARMNENFPTPCAPKKTPKKTPKKMLENTPKNWEAR